MESLIGAAICYRLGSFWPVALGLVSDDFSLRRVLAKSTLLNHEKNKKSRLEVSKSRVSKSNREQRSLSIGLSSVVKTSFQ